MPLQFSNGPKAFHHAIYIGTYGDPPSLRIAGQGKVEGDGVCSFCGGTEHGLAHVLGAFAAVASCRERFLHSLDPVWRGNLSNALIEDWPMAVLSPHLGVNRLKKAFVYVAAVSSSLRE